MAEPKALESSLNKLSLHPEPSKSARSFAKKQSIADSWEDEELEASDNDDDNDDNQSGYSQQAAAAADYPSAPPPTPISPPASYTREAAFANPYGYSGENASAARGERPAASSRPEKTDAVAKRMIAGALGVKAPKKTDEQRAYDRAIREKEMKKRNQEKEAAARAKLDAEKAKAAVWDD